MSERYRRYKELMNLLWRCHHDDRAFRGALSPVAVRRTRIKIHGVAFIQHDIVPSNANSKLSLEHVDQFRSSVLVWLRCL